MLYLDLDGVFADFHKRFKEICGFEYSHDPEKAWGLLEKEHRLFQQLELMPGAKEMYDEIKSKSKRPITFLTALPRLTGNLVTSAEDKMIWVATHLDPTAKVICSDGWRAKKLYCRPGDILVDDMQRNIDDWESVGGIGVQHNTPAETLAALYDLFVLRENFNEC